MNEKEFSFSFFRSSPLKIGSRTVLAEEESSNSLEIEEATLDGDLGASRDASRTG